MRVKVVQLLGRVYADVLVDVELPEDPVYADFVAAIPSAAAAASEANPTGEFAGMQLADGERVDWIVEGVAANGSPWKEPVEAATEAEAAFLAACSVLEQSRAGRPSNIPRLMEGLGNQAIRSVVREGPVPAP
ncbi:hypothetical protein BHAOGJBA_4434 [Methylobacterium hispanicum]|uniref:Uncharacterized protein n=1 Tax=Methylobacterium hispanicum TaxID=270350 RepID=A0AAV4ZQT5_9HYPH|nr:hypothetical protein [Methylobacterium hispanicum]GJD90890.1 hypothetical protein BHAOGJBA_4434 [Methylobacterium hispanicum]